VTSSPRPGLVHTSYTALPFAQNQHTLSRWKNHEPNRQREICHVITCFILVSFAVRPALLLSFNYSCRCHLHLDYRFRRWSLALAVLRRCYLHQFRRFSCCRRFSWSGQLGVSWRNQEA
jgi:hypothetical protein